MAELIQAPPLAELIDPPPREGSGLHKWAFYAANAAAGYGASPRDAAEFVLAGMLQGGRAPGLAERETRHAIGKAFGFTPAAPSIASPPLPSFEADLMQSTAEEGLALYDLWEASPVRFDEPRPGEIFATLFPDPGGLVCIAKAHPRDARTLPRAEALPMVQTSAFCCQSYLTAPTGLTQEGKPSPRTLQNIGPRRFAVVEFDPSPDWPRLPCEPVDAMAAWLWKLHELTRRLACAVHSGGKSLHGWFYVGDWPGAEIDRLFLAAAKFGADPATRSPIQLVRIPDGLRDNGNRQTCYFFNPHLIPND